MGQGACGGHLKATSSHRNVTGTQDSNNNMDFQNKIAHLEEKLRNKDAEIEALQVRFFKKFVKLKIFLSKISYFVHKILSSQP